MLATIASVDCKIRIITIKSRFIEMFGAFHPITELEDVCMFVKRGKSATYADSSDYYIVGQACIRLDCIEFNRVRCMDSSKYSDEYVLKFGDVLVNSTGVGSLGRCNAFYNPDGRVYFTDSHVTILRLKMNLMDPLFVKYYLNQNGVQADIYRKCVNGSTNQIELNRGTFAHFLVPVPPLELQNQFADFVRRVDKSKAICKQIFQSFDNLVKSRFIEMFEDNPESSNWCFSSLESICNGITDGSHNPPASGEKSNNLMISSKNIHDGTIDFEDSRYLTDEQFISENNRTKVQKDDLLMTIVGTIGRTAIVPDFENNVTFQRSVSVLHPKHELLNVTYLKESLDTIQPDLERLAHGSSQKGIYLNQVKAIQIKLPPIELQNQFADFVKQMNKSKFMSSMTATDSASLSEQGLV